MQITPLEISKILKCPLANAEKYYPKILEYLVKRGKNTVAFQVALLATIGVECGTFEPKHEGWYLKWSEPVRRKYFNTQYSNRADLGNLGGNDGYMYRGRGFVQLTGRANYRKYGKKIGIDLENNPELALTPENSTAILVEYAIDHGLDVWASRAYNQSDSFEEEFCWRKVRLLVNGGYRHYKEFRQYVEAFKTAAKTA